MIEKLVSGGQTGVDRAALDVALARKLPCGGWCPLGRRAEDGPIDPRYPLTETADSAYEARTRLNVRDSDATLILVAGPVSGGTRLTGEFAGELGRPLLVVDLRQPPEPRLVLDWLEDHRVARLNLAGPRESEQPGIYARARTWLDSLLP